MSAQQASTRGDAVRSGPEDRRRGGRCPFARHGGAAGRPGPVRTGGHTAGGGSIGDARFAYFSLADAVQSLLPGHDFAARQSAFQRVQEAETSHELRAMVDEPAGMVMERLDALRCRQHSDTVRRAAAWIEEHLGANISVDNVAEAVFLSSPYLNSLFKSEMRQTVFEYLSTLRIKRAESLLAGPKNPQVQEIAHAVGYYSVQSFIRLFKRHHGMTPAEYRRSFSMSEPEKAGSR